MSYTSQALITSYLKRNLSEHEAALAKTVIDSVTQYIDNETGQTWTTTGTGVSRDYVSNRERIIFIDPILNIESVKHINQHDEVLHEYETSEYAAFPLNATTKTSLQVGAYSRWGDGRIRVTGKWGNSDGVPSDIQLAATILAAAVFSSGETDNIKSESIEGYSVTYGDVKTTNQQVRDILDGRRAIRI